MKFLDKLKAGLAKTRDAVFGRIDGLFKRSDRVDEDFFDELEEILYTADVGVETTEEILARLRAAVKEEKIKEPERAREKLYAILREMVGDYQLRYVLQEQGRAEAAGRGGGIYACSHGHPRYQGCEPGDR